MNEDKAKAKRKRYDEGFKRAAVEHWQSNAGLRFVENLDDLLFGVSLSFCSVENIMMFSTEQYHFQNSNMGLVLTLTELTRLQLLTIESLLASTTRPEHPDYEPDLNFKKAKAEASGEQRELL